MIFICEYSPRNDADILYHNLEQIKKGNYQRKGILIFDGISENCPIPYANIPIQKLLNKSNLEILPQNTVVSIEHQWKTFEPKITILLEKFLHTHNIKSIRIHPTSYGVRGTQIETQPGEIEIWHRIDFPIQFVAITIIEAVIYKYLSQNEDHGDIYSGAPYQYKGAVLDFLFNNSVFSELVPNYKGLAKQMAIPEISKTLLDESSENYAKLGVTIEDSLSIKDEGIYLFGKKIRSLTHNQKMILMTLVNANSNIVTFDEIAKKLWGENSKEKFSLNAISKNIHDLRDKLRATGLQKEIIFTKRKEGYWLEK